MDMKAFCPLGQVGKELSISKPDELDRVMAEIGDYMDRRSTTYVSCLNVWVDAGPSTPAQEEGMHVLWQMVKAMQARGWEERAIYRPYLSFPDDLAEAPEVPCGASTHSPGLKWAGQCPPSLFPVACHISVCFLMFVYVPVTLLMLTCHA